MKQIQHLHKILQLMCQLCKGTPRPLGVLGCFVKVWCTG